MTSLIVPVPVILPQPIVPTEMFGVPDRLDAVEALPVTVPSRLATIVPATRSPISPVEAPVAVVVPSVNLSADSSYPIKALF